MAYIFFYVCLELPATRARWNHPSVGIQRPSRASNLASPATTLGLSWAFLYIFGVKLVK